MPPFGRNRRASERGLPQLCDDQAAEQARGLGAELSLGKIDEQQLALGEKTWRTSNRGSGCPDNDPQLRAKQEGPVACS